MLKKIEIQKKFDLEELIKRLKEVRLKGFPDVKIYEDADIKIESHIPELIRLNIFTPQPTVYQTHLDRIDQMTQLFQKEGIDIFKLNGGVDYTAHDENEEQTQWTIIPPVIEMIPIKSTGKGLSYHDFIAEELKKAIQEKGHKLNPELDNLFMYKEYQLFKEGVVYIIPIICDGSHRVHFAYEKGLEQNLLTMNKPKQGYPYYAAPKPYSEVHIEPERTEGGAKDKTHVLTEPGHKLLYRLFPSGGILSGTVRPGKN